MPTERPELCLAATVREKATHLVSVDLGPLWGDTRVQGRAGLERLS